MTVPRVSPGGRAQVCQGLPQPRAARAGGVVTHHAQKPVPISLPECFGVLERQLIRSAEPALPLC